MAPVFPLALPLGSQLTTERYAVSLLSVEVGSNDEFVSIILDDSGEKFMAQRRKGTSVDENYHPMYTDNTLKSLAAMQPLLICFDQTSPTRITVTFRSDYTKTGTRGVAMGDLVFQKTNSAGLTAKEPAILIESQTYYAFKSTHTLTPEDSGTLYFELVELATTNRVLHQFAVQVRLVSINQRSAVKSEIPQPQPQSQSKGNPFPVSLVDGPAFRSTLAEYEERIPALISICKVLSEDLTSLESSMAQTSKQRTRLRASLQQLVNSLPPDSSTRSSVSIRLRSACSNIDESYAELRGVLAQTVYPLLKNHGSGAGLETLATRKRTFEDESSKYYAWLSKYLGSGKTKDEKFLSKRKSFELSKIDYITFLSEFGIDKSLNREQSQRRLRARARIEQASTPEGLKKALAAVSVDPDSGAVSKQRSGILFTQNGQGKIGWHKQWVVLADGRLSEYMDWRKGESIRNKPIDISLASIKPVDGDKRKFCFRIITSDGVEHVFQTIDEDDREGWITALYDAGQQIRFGSNSSHSSLAEDKGSHKSKQDLALNRSRRISSVSLTNLAAVHGADASNAICAECSSTDSVEWISINLLTVFCVKCSSVHRSLGTTITKVKSLKLDNFPPEALHMLCKVSNFKSRQIWEARLSPAKKPRVGVSDQERTRFIVDKYSAKKYVSPLSTTEAVDLLIHGVRRGNHYEIIEALAAGADPNASVMMKGATVPLIAYALHHPNTDKCGAVVYDTAELLFLNGALPGAKITQTYGLEPDAVQFWQARINRLNPQHEHAKQLPQVPKAVQGGQSLKPPSSVRIPASTSSKFSLLKKKTKN
ncbi:unnamed protein product [Kuraishia capsulata CBS 1993]|uniref:ADP-ribosylation factor GTPase-activating protein n=1 Tax=Kuraishia capsulata CBS 1993 TaxID=1382522 RepID=W6MKH6_9ASCO|nr:uncharacterized protein KUCA_T00002986001 [Kuraishia capsulata CBS 1993]CDK27009.1 unnamed protein product [Kuraishia capsulata CBS 1993]